MKSAVTCDDCGGHGIVTIEGQDGWCPTCDGTGYIVVTPYDAPDQSVGPSEYPDATSDAAHVACDACDSTGDRVRWADGRVKCWWCSGTCENPTHRPMPDKIILARIRTARATVLAGGPTDRVLRFAADCIEQQTVLIGCAQRIAEFWRDAWDTGLDRSQVETTVLPWENDTAATCPDCGGWGMEFRATEGNPEVPVPVAHCSSCDGTGRRVTTEGDPA